MFRRKSMITSLTITLAMLCFTAAAHAATFSVSPTGNNLTGDGSSSNPWGTLSYACSKVATAGDIITLEAGSYNDPGQCRLAPGVSIRGAGKDQTTITSSLNDWYLVASANGVMDGNQTVSGFRLDGNNKTLAHGFQIMGRNNVTVDNVDFVRIKDMAIKLVGTESWPGSDQDNPPVPPPAYAKGCVLSNITITGCSPPVPYSAVWIQSVQDLLIDHMTIDESAGTGGLGNALKSYPGWVKHSVIRNSTFTVNPGTGMDAIPLEIWNWETDCEVYYNTFREGYISLVSGRKNGGDWSLKFHDNKLLNTKPLGTAHELALDDLDFHDNYIEGESVGIWAANHLYNLDGVNNIQVYNNAIHSANGQGITVQNGPGAVPLDNIRIYGNLIDTTNGSWPDAGVTITPNKNTAITNVAITGNTFRNMSYGVCFSGTNANKINAPRVTGNTFSSIGKDVIDEGASAPVIAGNMDAQQQVAAN